MIKKLLRIALPLVIVAVAIVGMIGLARMGKEPPTREPVTAALLVDTVQPVVKSGSFTIRAQGTVSPRIETSIVSEVSGQVIWVSEQFTAGGLFRAGDELLRIDPSDYQTALLAAEADLAAARATLADEQARSDAAREDFRRLYGDSRQPSELTLRLPQVARAKAAVQAQEAAVARAGRNLERTRIQLPFDGMIEVRNVDLGQYISIGSTLGNAFGTERAEIRLPLSENDLAYLGISPGDASADIEREITLVGSAGGEVTQWPARLVRSEGVVDRNTRLSYLVAEILDPYHLDDNSGTPPLPIGTFVEALIPGRDASGLLLLPAQALHEGGRVFIANEQDELEVIDIEVVRSTPREVYVRGDIGATDRIITTAIPAPVPGLKLNVRQPAADAEPMLRILPVDEELAADIRGGGA
jgi:RND family efflux transporter MFP subunit